MAVSRNSTLALCIVPWGKLLLFIAGASGEADMATPFSFPVWEGSFFWMTIGGAFALIRIIAKEPDSHTCDEI